MVIEFGDSEAELEAVHPRAQVRTVRPVNRPADELGERQACTHRLADQICVLEIAQGDLRSPTHLM